MKILYLVTNFNLIGGKERYDRDVVQATEDLGERVKVVKLRGKNLVRKMMFVFNACVCVLRFRPEMIWCAHTAFAPISYVLWRVFGTPYIIYTAGTEVWDIRKKNIKKALRHARLVVSISRYTTEKLCKQVQELEGKVFLLPPTVRENLFKIRKKPEYLIQEHNLRGKEVLLTVARLRPNEEEKGYLKVIDALSKLRKEFPNIKYLIVGAVLKQFGDNRERIKKYAKEKGVEDIVRVVGEVSDKELADYYNLCDVFVMPSKQEGFGIVFLEALACGKPVIGGNADGSRDALLQGKLGTLVNPESVEEIGDAIGEALRKSGKQTTEERRRIRENMLAVYGFDKFRERVVDLLHGLEREAL